MKDSNIEDALPENMIWDRKALEHLSKDLKRSKSQLSELMEEEKIHPSFDPLQVRNLMRAALRKGEHPEGIILGRLQMASFRHFVSRGFGEESGSSLRQHFFMGLEVFEDVQPTRLELLVEDESHSEEDDEPPHSPPVAA